MLLALVQRCVEEPPEERGGLLFGGPDLDSMVVGAVDDHCSLNVAEDTQLTDFLHETGLPLLEGLPPGCLVLDQLQLHLLLDHGGGGGLWFSKGRGRKGRSLPLYGSPYKSLHNQRGRERKGKALSPSFLINRLSIFGNASHLFGFGFGFEKGKTLHRHLREGFEFGCIKILLKVRDINN